MRLYHLRILPEPSRETPDLGAHRGLGPSSFLVKGFQWIGVGMILVPGIIARRLHVKKIDSFGDSAYSTS